MVRSKRYQLVKGKFAQNKDNVTYIVLQLYDKQLLLFGKGMFWGTRDATEGDICINHSVEFKYITCGSWKIIDESVELRIPSKGIFHLTVLDHTEFQLYEVEAETALERLAIEAVKNAQSRLQ
jgi:hypothetical protein